VERRSNEMPPIVSNKIKIKNVIHIFHGKIRFKDGGVYCTFDGKLI
jgi:hypothetical protein